MFLIIHREEFRAEEFLQGWSLSQAYSTCTVGAVGAKKLMTTLDESMDGARNALQPIDVCAISCFILLNDEMSI